MQETKEGRIRGRKKGSKEVRGGGGRRNGRLGAGRGHGN